MRAAVIKEAGGPEVISIDEVPTPEPGEGEVRIRVAYSALNPLDTHSRANRIPWMHPGFPYTPGFEYAGVVDAVGENVDAELLGQRVAVNGVWGGNADFAIAPAAQLNRVPDGFDWHTAATYSTCAYTSWLLIHSAGKVQPGQVVVIHSAAGAVGSLTTQVAKSAGAMVIGLAGGQAKLDYAAQFGADHLLDYNQEGWPQEVKELTGGKGANVIIDGNAGPNADRNLAALAPLGNVIYIGAMAGQAPAVNISQLIGQSCSVTGFVQYFHQAHSGGAEKAAMDAKLASGEWRIPVERVFSLEELPEAHRAFEGRELMGRSLIQAGGDL